MRAGVPVAGLVPALGLLLGAALGLNSHVKAWTFASCLAITCVVVIDCWRRRAHRAVLLSLTFGFLTAGAALAVDARERALHASLRQVLDAEFGGFLIESIGPAGRHDPVRTRVVLVEDAAGRDGFVSLRGEAVAVWLHERWHSVEGGVAINVNGAAAREPVTQWTAGRTIEAPIAFRRPARYLNDGVPDFERNLALDGVSLLGTVKSGLLVTVVTPGGLVSEWCAGIRRHIRRAVEHWIAPHGAVSAAIASAVLIGDRTGLPDATREALQKAGTYHVIAISGGNIAILAGAVTLFLLIAGVRGRAAAAVTIAALSAYALIVAAGPSVWRATLMAMLYFSARVLDHRSAAWQTTCASAALMIAATPLDIRDAGFILTFGATLALLEGARVAAKLNLRSRVAAWMAAAVVASLAIELALLPVSAALFSRVTAAGLLLNLLAVPLMGVVQIAALVTAATDGITAVAVHAGWVAHLAAQALIDSARLVDLAPWSTSRVPPPAALVIGAYYGGVAVMFFWRQRTARAVAGAVWLAAALAVIGVVEVPRVHSREPNPRLRLTVFDVGQGESILIETPAGRAVLIDAGGAPFGRSRESGERVLAPALWARGIRSLDTMLITHADPDHLGGAADLLADFAPRRLWHGITVPGHRPMQDVLDMAARLRVAIEARQTGDDEREGDLRMRVLNPPAPDWERRRVRNDDSVVLKLDYRDVSVLLTGDISAEVERRILPLLTQARTRILKIAHHGSRTSSSGELLWQWRPQFALISAGRGNTFGHPAPEVLQRLEAIGATVLRTDLHGQIMLETDGYEISARTFQDVVHEPR